jgi:hypothetical protein
MTGSSIKRERPQTELCGHEPTARPSHHVRPGVPSVACTRPTDYRKWVPPHILLVGGGELRIALPIEHRQYATGIQPSC